MRIFIFFFKLISWRLKDFIKPRFGVCFSVCPVLDQQGEKHAMSGMTSASLCALFLLRFQKHEWHTPLITSSACVCASDHEIVLGDELQS